MFSDARGDWLTDQWWFWAVLAVWCLFVFLFMAWTTRRLM